MKEEEQQRDEIQEKNTNTLENPYIDYSIDFRSLSGSNTCKIFMKSMEHECTSESETATIKIKPYLAGAYAMNAVHQRLINHFFPSLFRFVFFISVCGASTDNGLWLVLHLNTVSSVRLEVREKERDEKVNSFEQRVWSYMDEPQLGCAKRFRFFSIYNLLP